MSDKIVKLLSTWFYVGNLPVAPGTAASAVGVAIAIICSPSIFLYIFITLIVTILGFMVSGKMEKMLGQKDPGCIVIDEVAGIMLAFFLLPLSPVVVIVTFFLFRAFDMFKIYPVNKFEKFEGSTGVMMDDIIAGIYTNIVMQFAIRAAGII